VDEGNEFRPEDETIPCETPRLEVRIGKVRDSSMHSLSTEERDKIISKYNAERTTNVAGRTECTDTHSADSKDTADEENESIEKLAHLLDELAKVGNIAVSKKMKFLDPDELTELLAVGRKFLAGYKGSIVTEGTNEDSTQNERSEMRDVE
jgi:hypothetical protein